ncbi:MAG: hypothetical protein WCR21_13505, partial [Bacteroidota bacterium]
MCIYSKKSVFIGVFLSFFLIYSAQTDNTSTFGNISPSSIQRSNIEKLSEADTSIIKISLKNGAYSAEKKFLPYYALAYTTEY